jgi:hypothetical protein
VTVEFAVASAREDAEFASGLATSLQELGHQVSAAAIQLDNEVGLLDAIRLHPHSTPVYIVVVSTALSERIRSLVLFDEVLGTRFDGKAKSVTVCLTGTRSPSLPVADICARRGGVRQGITADDTARRIVNRFIPVEDDVTPTTSRRGDTSTAMRVVQGLLTIRIIVGVALAILAALLKCSS